LSSDYDVLLVGGGMWKRATAILLRGWGKRGGRNGNEERKSSSYAHRRVREKRG